MNGRLWFAALFAIGAGGGIALFWLGAIASAQLRRFVEGRTDAPYHVAAELLTAGLLIAGGICTIQGPDGTTSKILFGLGCGALSYALTEAPGHYLRRGPRVIAVALFATWPFLIAAVALRFSA
jgi:hypothetical protein